MSFDVKELWEQALIGYNLPLTVLFGLVVVFWLLTLLGAVDLDALDIDLDVETDGADGVGEGIFAVLLRFVNAHDIPVTIVLSLLSVFMWAGAILTNYYFNPEQNSLLAMAFLLVNLIISTLVVKFVTEPLRPFMRAIKDDGELQEPLVGMSGVVKSRVMDSSFGQVEVPRDKGAPALLNAILPEGQEPLVRGDQILVIDFDDQLDKYLVHPAPQGGHSELNN